MIAVPPPPFAAAWDLDPSVDYLNHGSFGACPRAVLAFQGELRARLEREPADFLVRDLPGLLAAARESLGPFLGARPDDLAFVPNATAGVNAVVRSLALSPGDELLATDHAYGACLRTLEHAASRSGARVVVARVPFPLEDDGEVLAPLLAAVTPRTRLALVDHVTSATALVFPIGRIVAALAERGVDTLVDGAHAPGMVPLDLDRLGAAYYTGNAHKWLCAPKGAAFLHVRSDRRRGLHPVVTSHGYGFPPEADGTTFRAEFDWTGTGDPTPWLSIGESLRFLGGLLPGGWPELMARNRSLALEARSLVAEALGVPAPCPAGMIGSIASLPLPDPSPGSPAAGLDPVGLGNWLRARGVESWCWSWPGPGRHVVRVSAQLYNTREQFRRLARLLREALGIAPP